MTDIAERLTRTALEDATGHMLAEAADEICRLRAENAKFLRRIHLFKNTRNEQVFEKLMKANEEIERLRFENETLNKIAVRETVKVAALRAALKPFADRSAQVTSRYDDAITPYGLPVVTVFVHDLRAAAKALKETGE